MKNYNRSIMMECINHARETMAQGKGGPFGAAVVKDGKVVVIASNSVLADNDPTAHAEMNAIRQACKILGTYDLSGCELYATSEPCPMCLSAIIWANIKTVYYGCIAKDAAAIEFRDDYIYDYIASRSECESDVLNLIQVDRSQCIKLFEEYSKESMQIY